ncbi:hypothetical protein [Polymorphospora rubra]|uniref:hypothetical protein n=1 Tax=Polymorphospora rubra TaxID=338584 RepID=UPI001FE7655E|nr:hypothetical protein [Polymorphospora rubra]
MRPGAAPRPAARSGLLGVLTTATAVLVTGCGSDAPTADPTPTPSATGADQTPARAQLAGLAAAAQDRHLSAFYTLSAADRADRTVAFTAAPDGSWRVDIPGGALGGTADVSVARTGDGLFQCALPSVTRQIPPTCVRVADPDGQLAAGDDPRVQHPLVSWSRVLTDRRAALSVTAVQPLPGSRGACFAVESTSASLRAPLDVGIYCYAQDGTLTGAKVAFGTLILAGEPVAAPPTVTLPGPVVAGEPLDMASPPPPPTPTVTPSGSPSPTPSA